MRFWSSIIAIIVFTFLSVLNLREWLLEGNIVDGILLAVDIVIVIINSITLIRNDE